jgi:hypothetical protein
MKCGGVVNGVELTWKTVKELWQTEVMGSMAQVGIGVAMTF